ncbi:MAG: exosome complex exonuclease Rrp41 [Candidatus Pacearchaeota archaeon]|nr:exosome complex exonuclease Rrp41 [Candidatus Pacearchaeota archaeon]
MSDKKEKRPDGREFDETRKIEAKVGVIKRADGSAYFAFGNSKAIAAVYGPRQLYPQHLQNPKKAILRCFYDMFSFSVAERKKPGPSRRSIEISDEIKRALYPVVLLENFPNTVIDVYVEIIEADASTRCAAINAASMALASAGVLMSELVTAVSVGKVGNAIVVDLSQEEEQYKIKKDGKEIKATTDIALAFLPRSKKISLLHLDGSIKLSELREAIELGKKICTKIEAIQRQVLKKLE